MATLNMQEAKHGINLTHAKKKYSNKKQIVFRHFFTRIHDIARNGREKPFLMFCHCK